MDLQSFLSWFSTEKNGKAEPSETRAPAPGQPDKRQNLRSNITSRIDVAWEDPQGRKRQMQSRGVNMSSVGALILSPGPVAVGSAVYLHSKEMQLMGNATVRHCSERKSKFLVGLEFRGPLLRTF